MRNDDSLATILLASRIAQAGVPPLNASQFWRLVGRVGGPGGLLERSERDLIASGLREDVALRVVGLLSRAVAMAFELDRLDQTGIATLTPFDDDYRIGCIQGSDRSNRRSSMPPAPWNSSTSRGSESWEAAT